MSVPQKYPVLIRTLHWLMAVGVLGMIASGWFMAGLDKEVSYKYDIYFWHKSFGVLALFAVTFRLLIRLCSTIPPLPESLHSHEKKLARLTHFLLYAMMFAVPTSGYLMSDLSDNAIPLFNWITMPDMFEENAGLAGNLWEIHTTIPYIFLGVIALHISAALKHRFFDNPENNVLKRML